MTDETVASNSQAGSIESGSKTIGLKHAILAPWHLFQPAGAAKEMALASKSEAILSFLAGIFVFAMIVLFSMVALDSLERHDRYFGRPKYRIRSPVATLNQWRIDGDLKPLLALTALVSLSVVILAATGALHYFVQIHRTGSIGRSLNLGFRASASGIGFLCCLVMVLVVVHFINRDDEYLTIRTDQQRAVLALSIEIAIIAHLQWLSLAVRGIEGAIVPTLHAPTCESCGYNLAFLAMDGRCPECGTEIKNSLDSMVARPGTAWQWKANIRTWIETTLETFLRPSQHYRIVRTSDHEQRNRKFALIHYAVIGLLSAVVFGAMSSFSYGRTSMLLASVTVGCGVALVVYAIHRALFSAAALSAFGNRYLQHGKHLRTIMNYEVVYLWIVWYFNLAMILYYQFGRQMLLPVGGNFLIFLFWVVRIVRAGRTIRWSNF